MPAFQNIEARIAAGEPLTVAQIEAEIAADPDAAAAFRVLAQEGRDGEDISVQRIAEVTGFPVEFLRAAMLAMATGGPVVGIVPVGHEGTRH